MKNITIRQYLDNLNYDFIETYSFKRGPKLELRFKKNEFDIDDGALIVNNLGQFDSTADKIAIIAKETVVFEEFVRIAGMPVRDIPSWMCAPFFRDALVFRRKDNQIVDTLNICFDCSYMQNTRGSFIDADEKVYGEFKSLLMSLGHDIQENESRQLMLRIMELKKAAGC